MRILKGPRECAEGTGENGNELHRPTKPDKPPHEDGYTWVEVVNWRMRTTTMLMGASSSCSVSPALVARS
jgi:hypothetical protein